MSDKLQGREGSQNAVWYGGRYLDPIRAAALHEAVQIVTSSPAPRPDESDTARATRVLHVATMVERWLAGTDKDAP